MFDRQIRYDLVGTREAAEIVDVQPSNFVRDWASRPDFPAPLVDIPRRRLWDRAAVEAYARRIGRRRGKRIHDLPISPEAARWLPRVKRRIVDRFNPDRIVLFGSQARGEATEDSDIDLLVIVPEERDRRGLVEAIRRSLADVGVSKDVFVTTPSHVARYGDVVGSLLEEALREGITVYARS
jgi:predicted nucleotidyltransferase